MVHTPIKGRAFESSGFQRWMISQNLAANLELMVEYYWYQAFCMIFIESKTRDKDTINCILYFMSELMHVVIFIPGTVKYNLDFWKFSPETIMSGNVEVGNVDRGNVAGRDSIFQFQSPAASDQITEKESLKTQGLL